MDNAEGGEILGVLLRTPLALFGRIVGCLRGCMTAFVTLPLCSYFYLKVTLTDVWGSHQSTRSSATLTVV